MDQDTLVIAAATGTKIGGYYPFSKLASDDERSNRDNVSADCAAIVDKISAEAAAAAVKTPQHRRGIRVRSSIKLGVRHLTPDMILSYFVSCCWCRCF